MKLTESVLSFKQKIHTQNIPFKMQSSVNVKTPKIQTRTNDHKKPARTFSMSYLRIVFRKSAL